MFFFDPEHLSRLATTHARAYREARPFPHVVLDGFLPEDVADALVAEFPRRGAVPWIAYDSATERKLETLEEQSLPPLTRHVISQCNGRRQHDFGQRNLLRKDSTVFLVFAAALLKRATRLSCGSANARSSRCAGI